MTIKVFKEVIRLLKEQNDSIVIAYKAGVDLVNFFDPVSTAVSHMIGALYGIEGRETFEWWCYEKEWGTRKDLNMTDIDGKVLCETIEDLFEYLKENAKDDYEIKKALSLEERMKVFKQIFEG